VGKGREEALTCILYLFAPFKSFNYVKRISVEVPQAKVYGSFLNIFFYIKLAFT
jgi:hypothetical protein